ncbi:MAG: DEAD/DEAH box helicase, partial [Phycisphaerales bacterium]
MIDSPVPSEAQNTESQAADTPTFDALGLADPIARVLSKRGYETPSPIQALAIPAVLEGRDVFGTAQTGTGKTAAFALPILHDLFEAGHRGGKGRGKYGRAPRALVLCPTRELAVQIFDSFVAYGRNVPLRHAAVYGGVSQFRQEKALKTGIDVLIATPGRLMDLHQQGLVDLGSIEVLVLDEADRMLDLGFVRDVKRIAALVPANRQTALFSATMPQSIVELTESLLRDPERVQITPTSTPIERIQQSVMFVARANKRTLLARLLGAPDVSRAIVFVRTKHGVDRVVDSLRRDGLTAEGLHGNKSQGARQTALDAFKRGRLPILVATDIAARGIDVHEISHVINLDLPDVPETYIHRIGRTARAGASGIALSFCEQEDRPYLVDIERLIGQHLDRVEQHHYPASQPPPPVTDLEARGGSNGG